MNKNLKIGLVGLVVVGLLGGGYWWYQKTYQDATKLNNQALLKDPFAGLTVPADKDAATKAILEEKLAETKTMYQKLPNIWETWVAIGNIHALLGDSEGALLAYQQSVTLQSNNIVAERNIADLYANTFHDYEKAAAHYRAAIRNEVNNAELYSNLVKIEWQKLNNPTLAESDLEEGLNRTRHNTDLLYVAVDFYTAIGKPDKAAAYAAEIKAKKPSSEPEGAVLGIPGR